MKLNAMIFTFCRTKTWG